MSGKLALVCREIATLAHKGQYRRVTQEEYITHPLAVAKLVQTVDQSEKLQAISFLHDVLEDTKETEASLRLKGIPDYIVSCVVVLTKREEESYSEYIERIRRSSFHGARLIKVADILHNLTSEGCTDKQKKKYCNALLQLVGK